MAATPARAGDCLDENLLAFAVELGKQETDARDVAARMGERWHETLSDHVFGHANERDSPGDRLKRSQRRRRPGDDRIGRGTDQSRRAIGEIIVGRLEARKNNEVFSFDETVEPQFVEQCLARSCASVASRSCARPGVTNQSIMNSVEWAIGPLHKYTYPTSSKEL